jgi:peptide deformylase
MAILKVAQIGHPVLRQTARLVTREELHTQAFQSFIDSMIETMHDASGAGLAANQVHNPVQVCVMEVNDNPRYPYKPKIPLTVLVNPVLTPLSETKFENFEGCLSVPDLRGVVRRYVELRVQAWDRHGNPIDAEVRGITAGTYPARVRPPRRPPLHRPRRGPAHPVHVERIRPPARGPLPRARQGDRRPLRLLSRPAAASGRPHTGWRPRAFSRHRWYRCRRPPP